MKLQNKWFIGAMLGAAVCLVSTSCVDEIKFGNSFLDKVIRNTVYCNRYSKIGAYIPHY